MNLLWTYKRSFLERPWRNWENCALQDGWDHLSNDTVKKLMEVRDGDPLRPTRQRNVKLSFAKLTYEIFSRARVCVKFRGWLNKLGWYYLAFSGSETFYRARMKRNIINIRNGIPFITIMNEQLDQMHVSRRIALDEIALNPSSPLLTACTAKNWVSLSIGRAFVWAMRTVVIGAREILWTLFS